MTDWVQFPNHNAPNCCPGENPKMQCLCILYISISQPVHIFAPSQLPKCEVWQGAGRDQNHGLAGGPWGPGWVTTGTYLMLVYPACPPVNSSYLFSAVAREMVRSRVAMYLGVCVYILLILVLTCFRSPACRKCCHPRNLPEEQPPGVTGVRSPLPHSSGAKLAHVLIRRVTEVASWPRTRGAIFGVSSSDCASNWYCL